MKKMFVALAALIIGLMTSCKQEVKEKTYSVTEYNALLDSIKAENKKAETATATLAKTEAQLHASDSVVKVLKKRNGALSAKNDSMGKRMLNFKVATEDSKGNTRTLSY